MLASGPGISGSRVLSRDSSATSRTQRRDPTGESAYEKHIAGRRVIETLRQALGAALPKRET
jgi:hypothetical protein